ncbi:hypothetical protein Lsed01_00828 [Demequina sediminis]|uniref:Uncharacterized protein n=1 Tax=Demequina sediminis TaxID=1930058 RepID=A0ABP9WEZ0_9MICO
MEVRGEVESEVYTPTREQGESEVHTPVSEVTSPGDEWGDVDGELGVSSPASPVSVVTPVSASSPSHFDLTDEVDDWDSVNTSDVTLGGNSEEQSAPTSAFDISEEVDDWDASPAPVSTPEVNSAPVVVTPVKPAKAVQKPVQSRREDHALAPTTKPTKPADARTTSAKKATIKKPAAPKEAGRKSPTKADIAVLHALSRMRIASVQHVVQMLSNSGYANLPEDHEHYIPLEPEKIRRRLGELSRGKTPYVNARYMSQGAQMLPMVYSVTKLGQKIADPAAAPHLTPFPINASKTGTSMGGLLITASYIAGFDAREALFIHESSIKRAIKAQPDSDFIPNWSPEMHPWAEAHELAVLVDGSVKPHEPDLVMLGIEDDGNGGVTHPVYEYIEIETSIKSEQEYVNLFRAYKAKGVDIRYLVHNTTLPGSNSREEIENIYNRLVKAAEYVWGKPIYAISGVNIDVVPDAWKTTRPLDAKRQ